MRREVLPTPVLTAGGEAQSGTIRWGVHAVGGAAHTSADCKGSAGRAQSPTTADAHKVQLSQCIEHGSPYMRCAGALSMLCGSFGP